MTILFKKLSKNAKIPTRATEGSAGFDLYSPMSCVVYGHSSLVIDLELAMAIPAGYVGEIHPRSGKSIEYQVVKLAGVIDSDYRKSVKVALYNMGDMPWEIRAGDRIAQLVVTQFLGEAREVSDLPDPGTRSGGFGSTGG